MTLRSLLFGAAPQPEPTKCHPGLTTEQVHHMLHGEVLTGLGGMGAAELCLRCGLDTYLTIKRYESKRPAVAPDDWPAINRSREFQK